MGEEYDKIFSDKPQIMVFDDCSGEFELIGTAVNGVSFEAEEESDCVPTKDSFSFSCEIPGLSKWFEDNAELRPVKEAQDMLARLRDYQALWHKYYGMGMRRERRQIERDFNALAQRFAIHCEHYGITIRKHD